MSQIRTDYFNRRGHDMVGPVGFGPTNRGTIRDPEARQGIQPSHQLGFVRSYGHCTLSLCISALNVQHRA